MATLFKITFFLCFILSTIVVNGQNGDAEGRVEADEDWAKGNAQYYDLGELREVDCDLYLEYLGVLRRFVGCIRLNKYDGYNNRIKEKLKEKYGRDMFISIKHDVHIFYDSLNKLKTRKAIFKEGEKCLLEWLNTAAQYLQDDKKSGDLGKHLKITLTFTVNKKGKCKKLNLTKTENPEFDYRLFRAYQNFLKHSRWLPAKDNGVHVVEEKTFDIVFNPD